MVVSPEAGAFRWRPSGLWSSSFLLPHSASFRQQTLEETSGETIWPLQQQEGGPENWCSEEAWVFIIFFFSRRYWVCRTPASSCYLWVCPESLQDVPCIKNSYCLSFCLGSVSCHWGTSVYLLNRYLLITYYMPGTGCATKEWEAPCSQGT